LRVEGKTKSNLLASVFVAHHGRDARGIPAASVERALVLLLPGEIALTNVDDGSVGAEARLGWVAAVRV